MEYARPIATWLTERRNYGGGYCSTQVPDHQSGWSFRGREENRSPIKTFSFRFESIITVNSELFGVRSTKDFGSLIKNGPK